MQETDGGLMQIPLLSQAMAFSLERFIVHSRTLLAQVGVEVVNCHQNP
jgi:hypothetical protein